MSKKHWHFVNSHSDTSTMLFMLIMLKKLFSDSLAVVYIYKDVSKEKKYHVLNIQWNEFLLIKKKKCRML